MSDEWSIETPCTPLRFLPRDVASRSPALLSKVRLAVTEVLASSPRLGIGTFCIVRGTYALEGKSPASVGVVVNGKSCCRWADLAPGAGTFETRVRIVALNEDPPARILSLIVAGRRNGPTGIRAVLDIIA